MDGRGHQAALPCMDGAVVCMHVFSQRHSCGKKFDCNFAHASKLSSKNLSQKDLSLRTSKDVAFLKVCTLCRFENVSSKVCKDRSSLMPPSKKELSLAPLSTKLELLPETLEAIAKMVTPAKYISLGDTQSKLCRKTNL